MVGGRCGRRQAAAIVAEDIAGEALVHSAGRQLDPKRRGGWFAFEVKSTFFGTGARSHDIWRSPPALRSSPPRSASSWWRRDVPSSQRPQGGSSRRTPPRWSTAAPGDTRRRAGRVRRQIKRSSRRPTPTGDPARRSKDQERIDKRGGVAVIKVGGGTRDALKEAKAPHRGRGCGRRTQAAW